MKPTVSIIVDTVVQAAEEEHWHIDKLSLVLTEAGASVVTSRVGLAAAPEAWAYCYLPGDLEAVTDPAAIARFPRTVAMIGLNETCRQAEKYAFAGAIHDISTHAYDRHRAGVHQTMPTLLAIQRDVAPRLGWEVGPINSSPKYAVTIRLQTPFGRALLAYLEAVLGKPG